MAVIATAPVYMRIGDFAEQQVGTVEFESSEPVLGPDGRLTSTISANLAAALRRAADGLESGTDGQ